MRDDVNQPAVSVFGNETVLLYFAGGLAIVFLALLFYDLARRRRRARRHRRGRHEGVGATLLKPVHRAQALQDDLEHMLHKRSRREHRRERKPPEASL